MSGGIYIPSRERVSYFLCQFRSSLISQPSHIFTDKSRKPLQRTNLVAGIPNPNFQIPFANFGRFSPEADDGFKLSKSRCRSRLEGLLPRILRVFYRRPSIYVLKKIGFSCAVKKKILNDKFRWEAE